LEPEEDGPDGGIKRMKTRRSSCNCDAARTWLNLAEIPDREELDYDKRRRIKGEATVAHGATLPL